MSDKMYVVKKGWYIDILHSDIWVSEDPDYYTLELDKECVKEELQSHPDGVYCLNNIELGSHPGQEGEYGSWEVIPHTYVKNWDVTQICGLEEDYVTHDELQQIDNEAVQTRVKELQNWVKSFSTGECRYRLYKLWNPGRLALREESGEDFTLSKVLLEFDNDSTTPDNIQNIKKQITEYFEKEHNENIEKGI